LDNQYIYPSVNDVVNIHDKIIDKSGGMHGVRDIGLVESAIFHIQNDLYYPNITEKVAHLIYSINKGHAFNDGNKRTSLSSAVIFLVKNRLNDKEFIETFVDLMEDVVVWLADSKANKDDLIYAIMFSISKYYGDRDSFNIIINKINNVLDMNKATYDLAIGRLSKNPITRPVDDGTKQVLKRCETRELIYRHYLKYK
jgi:death-on-curing protein